MSERRPGPGRRSASFDLVSSFNLNEYWGRHAVVRRPLEQTAQLY
jgi:hypothetical protein